MCRRPDLRVTVFCLAVSLLSAATLAAPADLGQFFQPGKLRVLILSGRNNHDWRTTTPFLRKMLVDTGRFDVRVSEEPAGTTAESLAPYDLIVVDYCGPRWGQTAEKAVEAFVGSGKGMVVVHGASYSFSGLEVLADGHKGTGIKEPAWAEYRRMVGGYWADKPEKGFHGQRHSFPVKIAIPDHPILQGMRSPFIATDELYHGMKFLPGTKVLAAAYDDPELGGTGKEEPILCATEYGKGRVLYSALGHEVPAMRETGFIATLVRGAEWAASGKVTIPPDYAGEKPGADRIRSLVVTGGHAYESSFYSVFEGYNDLEWTHAASNNEAFKSDLRKKYDVLVLYDYSMDLDEKGRRNLQDFVESGKGVVVLHHSIADYGSWPWWYKEVVGGRYVLKAEANLPASTYKHDEDLFVRPAMPHPITNGLGPIHIHDETYKTLWMNPDNKVLLTTDNPTSDRQVAWISPYDKSRVVYIQLGHDNAAYRHPAYRMLVKNAIRWASGRKP